MDGDLPYLPLFMAVPLFPEKSVLEDCEVSWIHWCGILVRVLYYVLGEPGSIPHVPWNSQDDLGLATLSKLNLTDKLLWRWNGRGERTVHWVDWSKGRVKMYYINTMPHGGQRIWSGCPFTHFCAESLLCQQKEISLDHPPGCHALCHITFCSQNCSDPQC